MKKWLINVKEKVEKNYYASSTAFPSIEACDCDFYVAYICIIIFHIFFLEKNHSTFNIKHNFLVFNHINMFWKRVRSSISHFASIINSVLGSLFSDSSCFCKLLLYKNFTHGTLTFLYKGLFLFLFSASTAKSSKRTGF